MKNCTNGKELSELSTFGIVSNENTLHDFTWTDTFEESASKTEDKKLIKIFNLCRSGTKTIVLLIKFNKSTWKRVGLKSRMTFPFENCAVFTVISSENCQSYSIVGASNIFCLQKRKWTTDILKRLFFTWTFETTRFLIRKFKFKWNQMNI